MKFLDDAQLVQVGEGDLAALVELDRRGLILAPDETLAAFETRLRTLREHVVELRQELQQGGELDFFGVHLESQDAIPPDCFRAPQETTRELFGFAIDWVPGFFTNYRMGFLFAGCAYYSYDDFFALFIVRKSFQDREKWLIYKRAELIAHELCHIARVGFRSRNYEEIFAYHTSASSFRRRLGGVLRTPTDTWLLLGSVGFLTLVQTVNVVLRPPELWYAHPMPLFFLGVFMVIGYVFLRYFFFLNRFRRALKAVRRVFGQDGALPALFRSSDAEVGELAGLKDESAAQEWFEAKRQQDVRWRVIHERFGAGS